MAPTAYRRERLEKFASLVRGRKEFYSKKADEYLVHSDQPNVGNIDLWRENKIKADVYDEVLSEIAREFEITLDELM